MALLNYEELRNALTRLGELAARDNKHIDLLIVGDAVMVLEFRLRQSTHDLDALNTELTGNTDCPPLRNPGCGRVRVAR